LFGRQLSGLQFLEFGELSAGQFKLIREDTMFKLILRSLETGGAGFGLMAILVAWVLAEKFAPRKLSLPRTILLFFACVLVSFVLALVMQSGWPYNDASSWEAIVRSADAAILGGLVLTAIFSRLSFGRESDEAF
jgi:hypothetical protein